MAGARYSAVLLNAENRNIDLGPIDVSDAQNEPQAVELGTKRAREWLLANGIDRVVIQIAEGPRGLSPIEVSI
jgi:hypothetical protein